MKLMSSIFLMSLMCAHGATAHANNLYLGALYNEQKISGIDRDYDSVGIVAGYQYNAYFALEARLAKGVSGYSSTYSAQRPDIPFVFSEDGYFKEDIDFQASMLIKASYPILKGVSVYALVGYSATELEISGFYNQYDSSGNKLLSGFYEDRKTRNDGFSYGLGLDYRSNEKFGIFCDYQVLPDFDPNPRSPNSWAGLSVGVNYYL